MQISPNEAIPGMALAADVIFQGTTLLKKDQVLDKTLIEMLLSCAVPTISVFDGIPDYSAHAVSGKNRQDTTNRIGNNSEHTGGDQATPPASNAPSTPKQRPSPSITVTVSTDGMSASLLVEPAGNPEEELDSTVIMNALAANNVVFGIDTAQIDKLVELWKQNRHRYEINAIAAGIAPRPGKKGSVRMLLRHLTSRIECDKVKATHYFWEAAAALSRIDRVYAGAEIAENQPGHISTAGKNIHGMPVFTEEVIPTDVILEEGAAFNDNKRKIIATIDGIAYQIDTVIGVIPVDFNGTFDIEVADDKMTAYCIVHPPGPGGVLPEKEKLLHLLADKGVCSGILDNEIDTLYALCGRGAFPSGPFVVARGIAPVRGNDGKVEYLFNTRTSLSPSIDEKGHADYKSINIVNYVKIGQKLASLISPTAGSHGVDVLGNTIPAEPGVAAKLPQGPHTVIDGANPCFLLAEVDGIVRLTGGIVEVCEGFVVPGDVDFSTGNINYNKTVVVNGDVKAGFEVHCGGDLQVNGTIEDSRISAGGNVLCKYGFVGQGKGLIVAKGDVNIGFMKNQTVRCFKNVIIAKEAINCTILSRNSVAVYGNPLSVVGGEIKARSSVTVYAAGNHTGVRTLLEAGVDFLTAEELAMVEEQYKNASGHYHTLAEEFAGFRKTIAGRRHLSTIERKKIADLAAALKQAKQQLAVLNERKSILAGKMHPIAEAFIRIEHVAFPGTLFKFGDRHYMVKEELAGPKNIRYIEHEIRIL